MLKKNIKNKNCVESLYLYFSVDDITSNLISCLINCSTRDVLPNAAPAVSIPPLKKYDNINI